MCGKIRALTKRLNIKAKLSESTDWSDFGPVTSKSFLVITRSNVFPAICVGIVTRCNKLYWLSKALNLFAPESDCLFTWKLKSPTIKCFPVVVCRWHRTSLNSVWKTVVKFPEGLYKVIIRKTSESEKRFTVWCSNEEYFSHFSSWARRKSRYITPTPPRRDDLWVSTIA